MKLHIKPLIVTVLAASALFCGAFRGNAQNQLLLDPTQNWIGYMNVYELPSNGGAYDFGSAWGTGSLTAYYDTHTNILTLIPCTNVWETTDGYWFNTNNYVDTPNKSCDASYYVQFTEPGAAQTYTFSGNCISNTFNGSYTSTVFIKEFSTSYQVVGSISVPTTNGQPFSISLNTEGGEDYIQYGFETVGPDQNPTNGYAEGEAIYQVQHPAIEPSAITSQAAVQGQSVSFAETPTGDGPFVYQWQLNGANLANGDGISGVTSSNLTISDVSPADAGMLTVNITNAVGSNAVGTAYFAVDPLVTAQTNICLEPCFDSGLFAPDPTVGWYTYGGSDILNTGDYYSEHDTATSPDVTTVEGTNVLEEYSAGAGGYTGVYQNRPALPGQVYTASAWFFTPDAAQAGVGQQLQGNASANLQVQFYDGGGNLLCDYESAPFTTNYAEDVWVQMPVTNKYAADFVTLLSTGPLIVSPPGTASVRIQPGYHSPTATDFGAIYIDLVDVTLHETPASVTLSGSTLSLSFPTFYGPQYNVLYTSDLVHGPWQVLTSVTGDGTVKTVTGTVGSSARYYIINTRLTGPPTE